MSIRVFKSFCASFAVNMVCNYYSCEYFFFIETMCHILSLQMVNFLILGPFLVLGGRHFAVGFFNLMSWGNFWFFLEVIVLSSLRLLQIFDI